MSRTAGDEIPSVEVYKSPTEKIRLPDIFTGKRAVLLGVPGAFTPVCHRNHLPGFVDLYDKFKAKGVDIIACVAVNDPYVMEAWAKSCQTDQKIIMLADPEAKFTRAMGMEVDLRDQLGGVRSKRYACLVENNVIEVMNLEPDATGLSCSLAETILHQIVEP